MFKNSKINTKYLLVSLFFAVIFLTIIYVLITYLPKKYPPHLNQNVLLNNSDYSNSYATVGTETEKQNLNTSNFNIDQITSEKQNSKSLKQVLIELTNNNKTAEELYTEIKEFVNKSQELNYQIQNNVISYIQQDNVLSENLSGNISSDILNKTLTLRCKLYFDWRMDDSLLQKKQTSNLVEMLNNLGKKINESDECFSKLEEFNQTLQTLFNKLIENAKNNKDSNCVGFTNETELENFMTTSLSNFSDDISNLYSKLEELDNSCKKIRAISQALANELS